MVGPFRKVAGFSLVELMVVVAIISILASVGMPRFRVFQAKARQTEAKTTLSYMYTLEQAYYGDNDTYYASPSQGANNTTTCTCAAAGTNLMGFYLDKCVANGCKVRYSYSAASAAAPATIFSTFTATASSTGSWGKICPGSATNDIWTMTHLSILAVASDAAINCN
jgi:prepilin-type N-terminal cleavage/methylation domain-containing protein